MSGATIFEVQRRVTETEADIPVHVHVGYMNILFKTEEDAINYFEKQGRSKIVMGYGYDDFFRYVIRKYLNEHLTIEPFDCKDTSEYIRDENGKFSLKMYVPTD